MVAGMPDTVRLGCQNRIARSITSFSACTATTSVCQGGLLLRGTDYERVCVQVVTDRLVHEQFPNSVAIFSDRNEGGFLLVVCHRSLHEHRRDLVPIRSENDKLQASGILDVLHRFGTCRDHRWDSSLLVHWLQQSIPETSTQRGQYRSAMCSAAVACRSGVPGLARDREGCAASVMRPDLQPERARDKARRRSGTGWLCRRHGLRRQRTSRRCSC